MAVTMADFPQGLVELGETWAHEASHFLGIFRAETMSATSCARHSDGGVDHPQRNSTTRFDYKGETGDIAPPENFPPPPLPPPGI